MGDGRYSIENQDDSCMKGELGEQMLLMRSFARMITSQMM